jgi:hypothetical protein
MLKLIFFFYSADIICANKMADNEMQSLRAPAEVINQVVGEIQEQGIWSNSIKIAPTYVDDGWYEIFFPLHLKEDIYVIFALAARDNGRLDVL